MRQKRCLDSIVTKYVLFLQCLRENQFSGQSLKYLVQVSKINKSVIKGLISLKFIDWESDNKWGLNLIGISKTDALELLNYLLELNKKQIVTPIAGLDDETKGYIKAIHDHIVSNSQNKQGSSEGLKTPMISKALNQDTPTHLFSQVESNEAKKFELLKSIAGGVYNNVNVMGCSGDISDLNESIISATEDLFNKFFSKKQ